MQWFGFLLSFILGKFINSHSPGLKESFFDILQEATYRSRKAVMLLLGGLACILILCGGFFMSVIDLTNQFDREGTLHFTANFTGGIILVAIALSVFSWIFVSVWPGARNKKKSEPVSPSQTSGSALEQALSLLVMDFIKEREYKRAHKRENNREHHEPPIEK